MSTSGEESSGESPDVERAPRTGPARTRTARQVIDQAIKDNRPTEWLLYGFAIVFVLVGTAALICGMVRGDGFIGLVGVIANGLFYPAMTQAREIRRENLAIRLFESPLSKAETAMEAAQALHEFFEHTFLERLKVKEGER